MTATGEQVALQSHAMSYRGTAVARLGGQAVFVAGALPGELVLAQIERRHRDYLEARTVEVIEPSPHRVLPRCAHFGQAGSCEWEFIAYPEQLRLKSEILQDQLRRVGRFNDIPLLPAIPSPVEWEYRNHVRLAIDPAGNPSYLRRASHIPVPVPSCAVLVPWIDAALPALQGRLRGFDNVEIRYGVNTSEPLVAPSLEGRGIALPSGQPFFHEELSGRRFRVSASSFFQVNTAAAEALAHQIVGSLGLTGKERVADCYAGVGVFACLLSPHASAVVAIESSVQAVEDGRLNAGFLENVRYRKGLVEQVLPAIAPAPDVVVLDPPRAGCDRTVIAALLAGSPSQIAYVSCDAATLGRDLRLLVDGGYQIRSTRVVDMFPQTYHIEALTLLDRVK